MTFPELAPTPASYLKAARLVESSAEESLRPLRLGVLSTFTAEFLRPYLVVEGARRGLRLQPFFGPWGQLEEQASDPASELYGASPEAILILTRMEDLCRAETERLVVDEAELAKAVEEMAQRLQTLLTTIRRHIAAPVLVSNFTPAIRLNAGLADAGLGASSQAAFVQACNTAIAAVARECAGVFVLDVARVATEVGLNHWTDPKLFYLARVPYSVPAQIALGSAIARSLRAATQPSAKVLVLDLDNTLWGGVLGEDGLGGIALGDEYPGSVYKEFQRYLLTLKDRGVLLAIATKNNPADVEEFWAQHRDCVLRTSDFAAVRINWEEKSGNIRAIAGELNVGLDSIVFFDDSPFERAEVRRHLPMVTVIEAPESALGYIEAIEASGAFDRLTLSDEDRQRSEMYRQQAARTAAAGQIESREEFLASLNLVATIGEVGPAELPRVAQLLAKTNQFNLTTRRHTAAEIQHMRENGAIALWLRLADRFGDNGLVGVAIAVPDPEGFWKIDTFLLSCRVIGRGAETALLAELVQRVLQQGGGRLLGIYIPSAKNAQVVDFYPRHGFQMEERAGHFVWTNGADTPLQPPDYIAVSRA